MLPYHVLTQPHFDSITPPPELRYPFPLHLLISKHLLYLNPVSSSIQTNLIIVFYFLLHYTFLNERACRRKHRKSLHRRGRVHAPKRQQSNPNIVAGNERPSCWVGLCKQPPQSPQCLRHMNSFLAVCNSNFSRFLLEYESKYPLELFCEEKIFLKPTEGL